MSFGIARAADTKSPECDDLLYEIAGVAVVYLFPVRAVGNVAAERKNIFYPLFAQFFQLLLDTRLIRRNAGEVRERRCSQPAQRLADRRRVRRRAASIGPM